MIIFYCMEACFMEMESINEKDKKNEKLQYKQLVLIILITVIMVLISLGLSFSIVKMLNSENDSNFNTILVPVKPQPGDDDPDIPENEKFVFTYHEKDIVGNGIYIENMFPTTDLVGKALIGENNNFEFSVHFNHVALNHYYEVTASMTDDCDISGDYIKVYLLADDEESVDSLRDDGSVKAYTDYPNASVDATNAREKVIYSETLSKADIKKGHKDFNLKMWLADNTPMNDETMNKKFAIKINVYAK